MEMDNYAKFLKVMRTLRGPEGCPWDREQTHESLKMNLVEESYEVKEAIDNHDTPNLCEELGDALLLIVFHSIIAEEKGEFTMADVLEGITNKMVTRHPHVFAKKDKSVTSAEILDSWEDIKKKEKHENTIGEGMERVAKALPALVRAAKLQEKAKKAGRDLEGSGQTFRIIRERLARMEKGINTGESESQEEEFGELMFDMVALARFLYINAENSLTNASNAFINRFVAQEKPVESREEDFTIVNEGELEALWRLDDH